MGFEFSMNKNEWKKILGILEEPMLEEPILEDVSDEEDFDVSNGLESIICKDNKETYVISAIGIKKEDLNIELEETEDEKCIHIYGETKNDAINKTFDIETYIDIECDRETENVSSKLENGLLYITIEYKEPEDKKQTIKIEIQ